MTAPNAGRWAAGVRREVLPNGLTLLVAADPSSPAAAVVTHVKAGFFDEPDAVAGISHVLEHMFFKGTPSRAPGAIARETKAAGGYLNASTSYDRTSYYAVLPASRLGTALEIQADALMHASLDAEELRRELQVIIQEAKRKLDSPSAVAHETLHELLFDRHRIRRWRIGTEAALAALTADDLRDYYETRYVPERTIVALAGGIEPEAALAVARATYGAWPARPGAVDPSPGEPARHGARTRTLRGDVAQAELVIGWRTMPPGLPGAAELDLAAAILGSGRGSRLWRLLREPGLATAAGAWHMQPTEVGVFSIGMTTRASDLPDVLRRAGSAVVALASEAVATTELERARSLVLTRWHRAMESSEARASTLASAEAMGGLHTLDEEYAALEAATPAGVRDAVAQWLAATDVAGLAYLPHGDGDDLTTVALVAACSPPAATTLAPITAPTPVVPPAASAREAEPEAFDVWRLSLPGCDLLVRRKAGVPLVSLGVHVLRAAPEAAAEAGVGALASRASTRGAGSLDAAALALAFERLGGALSTSAGLDACGLGASVLAPNFAEAASLLHLVASAPQLSDEAVEAERRLLQQEAKQVADDMVRYPFQLAFRAAFGAVGYGLPVGGTLDSLPTLTATAVRTWHAATWRGGRPLVVAVGDLDPHAALATLAGIFADFGAPGAVTPPATRQPWQPDASLQMQVVPRAKAQTALAMVFPGPGRADPLRYAADVWAAVASGLGGRLFEALRDRRSLAYTVMASAWQRRNGGALLTYIATGPEREAEAREQMLVELGRFAREPVETAELGRAVEYLAGQAEVARQSGSAIAGEIAEAWLAGDPLASLEDPGAPYRVVSLDDAMQAAAAFVAPERRGEGVVRGSGGGR